VLVDVLVDWFIFVFWFVLVAVEFIVWFVVLFIVLVSANAIKLTPPMAAKIITKSLNLSNITKQ
jgi:hypothetical protein